MSAAAQCLLGGIFALSIGATATNTLRQHGRSPMVELLEACCYPLAFFLGVLSILLTVTTP